MRRRVREAVTTVPGSRGWLETFAVGLAFCAVALPLGLSSGVLRPTAAPAAAFPLLLRTFFVPSLVEELVFRVLPPPRSAGAALLAYVLSHPLNALLFLPSARDVFYGPVFLLLTALLGGSCALLYRRTRSLWPPVALHWLAVAGWLLFLGGESVLR